MLSWLSYCKLQHISSLAHDNPYHGSKHSTHTFKDLDLMQSATKTTQLLTAPKKNVDSILEPLTHLVDTCGTYTSRGYLQYLQQYIIHTFWVLAVLTTL